MTWQRLVVPVTLMAGTIAAASVYLFAPELALISCLLGWTMLSIAVIDAQSFIVPDILSLPSIVAGLLVARLLDDGSAARPLMLEHLIAALVGAAAFYAIRQLYYVWRKREGLGLGDVKLAAVAGAWTGIAGIAHVLLLACTLAISYVLVAHLQNLRSLRGSTAIAFGVFLAPSIWFVWCANALGIDLSLTRLLLQP
jgi:leader peptidase (prepilin peptidase) / N-methyltransferase